MRVLSDLALSFVVGACDTVGGQLVVAFVVALAVLRRVRCILYRAELQNSKAEAAGLR